MCLKPLLIENPYYGLSKFGLNFLRDTTHKYLPVPCGHCRTCIALRQSYFIQRCQMEAFDNDIWYFTITYQNSMLPRRLVNGLSIPYPDFSDVQKMFKRIRKRNFFGSSFRYFVVSEYGGETHRPHFHGMIFTPKIKGESLSERLTREYDYHHAFFKHWCRNVGSKRKPIYKPCSKYIITDKGSTYDFHWVNPSSTSNAEADVGFYITKYILKSSKYVDSLKSALKLNLDPDEFVKEWSFFKPRCCVSKGFGNFNSPKVKEHIERGIKTALSDSTLPYPIFINPISGQEFPLAPCYKKRFLELQDAITFWTRGKDDDISLTDNHRQNVQDVVKDDIWLDDVRDYLDISENSFNYLDLDFYA